MRTPLRESIDALTEFMDASSYPGPEPGRLWSLSNSYPGNPASQQWRDLALMNGRRRSKKKKADIRPHLRKLSLWLQQKGTP